MSIKTLMTANYEESHLPRTSVTLTPLMGQVLQNRWLGEKWFETDNEHFTQS